MRIPLDYYQIIGLPLQATAEQLEQAYQDRLRQVPHSELTQGTLEARKELLAMAYGVLSDPEQRSEYDANYLLATYEVEPEETVALPHIQSEEEEALAVSPHTPILDLKTPEQLLGALTILYELGEYERVQKLSEWILAKRDDRAVVFATSELSSQMQKDLLLIFALSCWELGRELWRQESYEVAGEAVEQGYQLLRDWDLFSQLRSQMASELNKLSPYRIFELLSKREVEEEAVDRAIALLQEMFKNRGGIDGDIPDDSGLDVDQFLHFVQQIREYLTAAEQEALFTQEAKRPSGVATYLAACAGIAKGFTYLEPYSIIQARRFLRQLAAQEQSQGNRADLCLEESICALLLGETDVALDLMEKSQESDSIAQIQAYAAASDRPPDLLLGLCTYTEKWLESVLFPKFWDLADRGAALKDYFASESVQETLESLQEDDFSQEETFPARPRERQHSPHPVSAQTSEIELETPPEEEEMYSSVSLRRSRRPKRRLRFSSKASRVVALLLVGSVGLSAVGLFLFGLYQGVTTLWSTVFSQETSLEGQQRELALEINAPPLTIPSSESSSQTAQTRALNRDRAETIVRTWLSSKAQALGPEHQAQALSQILTEPLLSSWQSRSQTFENRNIYQQFRHSVTINNVNYSSDTPDQGQITATVREVARFYRNGNQVESQAYSYDSTLDVRYDVVRADQNWRIEGIEVLN